MANDCCASCMIYGLIAAVLVAAGAIAGNELGDTKGMFIGGGVGFGAWALFVCHRYFVQGCNEKHRNSYRYPNRENQENMPLNELNKPTATYTY